MTWRKVFRILHRDVGYVAAALTIIYSISGIAVNHIDDWNPNYIIDSDTLLIKSFSDSLLSAESAQAYVISELNIVDSVKSSFRTSPYNIDIFLDGETISANLSTGLVVIETIEDRPVIKKMNYLHLNKAKGLWTWVADIFAVALILLAITGLFLTKGKKGFSGRGKWLFLLGMIIPIIFLFFYYFLDQ
jgi:hypothetical protein